MQKANKLYFHKGFKSAFGFVYDLTMVVQNINGTNHVTLLYFRVLTDYFVFKIGMLFF